MSGVWKVNEARCHIDFLELKAAYLAIQCFLKERSGVNVLLRLDNRTAIAYLNHMGGIYDLSMLSSNRDMGVVPSTGDNDPCRISAWHGECSSRLGVTSPQRQQQLASVTSSLRCIEPIAWPFFHRLFCIQDQSSVAN